MITPQTNQPPRQEWRRPLLALADAVDAPKALDLTRLGLERSRRAGSGQVPGGSAAEPRVAIKWVVCTGAVDRIRTALRPGGIGVYLSVDTATTS